MKLLKYNNLLVWQGPSTNIASLPGAGNIQAVYRFSPNSRAYVMGQPSNQFGVTTFEPGQCYILQATADFDVSDDLIAYHQHATVPPQLTTASNWQNLLTTLASPDSTASNPPASNSSAVMEPMTDSV